MSKGSILSQGFNGLVTLHDFIDHLTLAMGFCLNFPTLFFFNMSKSIKQHLQSVLKKISALKRQINRMRCNPQTGESYLSENAEIKLSVSDLGQR